MPRFDPGIINFVFLMSPSSSGRMKLRLLRPNSVIDKKALPKAELFQFLVEDVLQGVLKKPHFRAGCADARMSAYAHSCENSRPYEQQRLITHRAGFILKGFTLKGIQPCQ
jgi:hypothetical protein